ncbi:MAG: hypothetical protein IJK38_09735 [Oscillospiraceae bacterium]|nr:hypothetical protein [Oscillospiraceae bacterium]
MEINKIKTLTRLSLMIMTPEAREERFNSLVSGNRISCPAVAALIDEARDQLYILTDRESKTVDDHQKIQIRWMLTGIDGAEVVRSMSAEELAAWVLDLRENKTIPSSSDLWTVAKSMMKRE